MLFLLLILALVVSNAPPVASRMQGLVFEAGFYLVAVGVIARVLLALAKRWPPSGRYLSAKRQNMMTSIICVISAIGVTIISVGLVFPSSTVRYWELSGFLATVVLVVSGVMARIPLMLGVLKGNGWTVPLWRRFSATGEIWNFILGLVVGSCSGLALLLLIFQYANPQGETVPLSTLAYVMRLIAVFGAAWGSTMVVWDLGPNHRLVESEHVSLNMANYFVVGALGAFFGMSSTSMTAGLVVVAVRFVISWF